jgi:hypothetical protein
MKYIINESKFDKIIFNLLDEMYPVYDISYYPPVDFDDESDYDSDGDCLLEFFMDGKAIFEWADNCHFIDYQPDRPLVYVFKNENSLKLYSLFGSHAEEPFKDWFKERFGYPVNRVILPNKENDYNRFL